MKALTALLIVAFLSFSGPARGQDGGHSHAIDVEQDAAIAERKAVDEAQGAEIIDLKAADAALDARLSYIESLLEDPTEPTDPDPVDPDPVEPPDPDPQAPPVYLIGADGLLGPRILNSITVDGPFNVCLFSEDGVEGPVIFAQDGVTVKTEGQSGYCLFGGNDETFPVEEWFSSSVLTITTGNFPPLTIDVKVNGPTGPPSSGEGRLQVGLWFPSTFNLEDPFVNFINPSPSFWEGGGMTTPELIEKGYINARTGLPTGKPGLALQTGGYFEVGSAGEYMPLRDGDWVFECLGASATLKARELGANDQRQTGPCRLEFTRDAANGKTPYRERFFLSNISGPVTGMRLYRKEHEALIKSGQIYNPDLLEAVKGYDIIRMMDMQSANMAVVTSVDQLASMDAPFYGNADGSNANGEPWMRYENTYQGMPLEAVFSLGTESGKSIWFQVPITLGAPGRYFDYRPDDDRYDKWATAFAEAAGERAPQVIESEEWDRYAEAFVQALIESGYPADRPLYVSLANEVWNWSGQYWLTTKYALETGKGLTDYLGFQSGIRESYGAFLARFKLALDNALALQDRSQNITYAVEGQAAWIELTGAALRGAKAFMEKQGEDWNDHRGAFGVSVASYWGYNDNLDSAGIDYNDLDALETFLMDGPESFLGTRANIVRLFRGAQAQGAQYGVRLLGAYEGGPHFLKPSQMARENYREFIWGERGARINKAVTDSIHAAFPGIVVSNYGLAGAPGGQPWFEGPIGCQDPYCLSWTE